MKRVPFERPAEYYDERLLSIDEQICSLLKQRKEISSNRPGFPPLEEISKWADNYGLYEDLLRSLFGVLVNDDHFKPQIEPKEFIKYLSVLKSVEKEQSIYSVIFIKQYTNASVIHFNIDCESADEPSNDSLQRDSFWELSLGDPYETRMTGGSGSEDHISYNFTVSPPLPDDVSGINFTFKEYKTPFKQKPTGLEIAMYFD